MTVPHITLADGHTIPQLGFGVWQVDDEAATPTVEKALEVGYRHIDTAAIYGNEAGVGRAIRNSGISHDELFVTTKLWNDDLANPRKALETSLQKLGLDRVDLYLIHWPSTVKHGDAFIGAWETMQALRGEGLVQSIGVCNFAEQHLAQLTGEVPVINQVELHPTFQQEELRRVDDERDIATEAWSPLGQNKDLEAPEIARLATKHHVTPAQVVIRWHLQLGNVVIPKSVTPERISSNFDVFAFELDGDDMAAIDGLDAGNRLGPDPVTADF